MSDTAEEAHRMAYTFEKGMMYRMPTRFEPSSRPRQGKDLPRWPEGNPAVKTGDSNETFNP
jgi:hypothetical protein